MQDGSRTINLSETRVHWERLNAELDTRDGAHQNDPCVDQERVHQRVAQFHRVHLNEEKADTQFEVACESKAFCSKKQDQSANDPHAKGTEKAGKGTFHAAPQEVRGPDGEEHNPEQRESTCIKSQTTISHPCTITFVSSM